MTELEQSPLRRRADRLTGAVLGPCTLCAAAFLGQVAVDLHAGRGGNTVYRFTAPPLDPVEGTLFITTAVGVSALSGYGFIGGWRGAATMIAIVTLAALAAGGTALSPFAPGEPAPAFAALGTAVLAGAALFRPRP